MTRPASRAFHLLLVLALLPLASCVHRATTPTAAHAWAQSRQLVLVTSASWEATEGELRRYERHDGRWRPVSEAVAVSLGRNGTAWGLGLHPTVTGPEKREGDGRAPAGVFALGPAFGYARSEATRMPYLAMDAEHWCIDVVDSPLYNRIVDQREVGAAATAGSTEPMRLDLHANGDPRYRQGIVIAHNPGHVPGAGSCIFAHLWRRPGEATAGCTSMDELAMRALLDWLEPAADPVFVLLPASEYARLRDAWDLPR
ncbi:hypothetical protein BH23PSE2_BH23PSE2_03550 [soil metagenome]